MCSMVFSPCRLARIVILTVASLHATLGYASEGQLRLLVIRLDRKPLSHVVLSPAGGGGPCKPTDDTGFTVAHFTYDMQVPYKLSLMVKEPSGLHFVSPIDGDVPVPHCSGTQCFERVVLARRGERLDAASLKMLVSIVAEASLPRLLDGWKQDFRDRTIDRIAEALGIESDQLDSQLREWAHANSDTPENRVLSAYYLGDSTRLQRYLFAAPPNIDVNYEAAQNHYELLSDVLFGEGRYSDSAEAARTAVALNPTSGENLNRWGLAMAYSFKTPYAELAFRTSKTDAGTYNLALLQAANANPIQAQATLERLLSSGSVSPPIAENAERTLQQLRELQGSKFLDRRTILLFIEIVVAAGLLALLLFRALRFVKPLAIEDIAEDEPRALQLLEKWFDTQLPEMARPDRRKIMWRIIRHIARTSVPDSGACTILPVFDQLAPGIGAGSFETREENIREIIPLLRTVERADAVSRRFSIRLAISLATLSVVVLVAGYMFSGVIRVRKQTFLRLMFSPVLCGMLQEIPYRVRV